MFDTAVDYGLINFNPSRVLSKNQLKFKLPSGNQPVFTLDERNKLMIYLKNLDKQTVYTLAVQLAFCFCLRIGELRALTWDDYDEDTRTVFIWHQIAEREENGKKRSATDMPHTKTNTKDERRHLFVTDEAVRIFSELRKINGSKKYILNSRGEKPIGANHFNQHLREYCKKAGVNYKSSHGIRHYGATQLFDAGVEPEQIRREMGHTTIAMTEQYNHTNGHITVEKQIYNRVFGSPTTNNNKETAE